MDVRNENIPVIDAVSNYTVQQFFNALQGNVFSAQQYRDRLLLQNSNNQASEVTNLFTQYGY